MSEFEGQIAVVTGAATGIGLACTGALAMRGATVIASDCDEEELARRCKALSNNGLKVDPYVLDVADEGGWQTLADQIVDKYGGLHILINNAGLCIRAPLLEIDLSDWRRQNSVNLDGVFLGTKTAVSLMTRSGGGSIVNIASTAGRRAQAGLSGYGASKAGVAMFSKAVALECAEAGNKIRVNVIFPGAIETSIWLKMQNQGKMPENCSDPDEVMARRREVAAKDTPLNFAGQPDDIAQGVIYLCSGAARYVTGASLVIDGGRTA